MGSRVKGTNKQTVKGLFLYTRLMDQQHSFSHKKTRATILLMGTTTNTFSSSEKWCQNHKRKRKRDKLSPKRGSSSRKTYVLVQSVAFRHFFGQIIYHMFQSVEIQLIQIFGNSNPIFGNLSF